MTSRAKISIDWRLARDLLDLPTPPRSAWLRRFLTVVRVNHQTDNISMGALLRDAYAARELLRTLTEVIAKQGATATRAKFKLRQVAKSTGINLIDTIGLLDTVSHTDE